MNHLKVLFYISSVSFLAYYVFMRDVEYSLDKTDKYAILYWTTMFGKEDFNLGLDSKIFKNCEFSNCFTTADRTSLDIKEFSALIFHHFNFDVNDLPLERSPEQHYILFTLESPSYTTWKPWNHFYNWTMTYRLDSDIVHPYGYIKKQKLQYKIPKTEDILKRPGKIAWLVSNCNSASRREKVAEEINLHMPVDIIGKCNTNSSIKCPKHSQEECYKLIESNYKFYLSFENSLCKDYVTEKFYNILKLDTIPIVYGKANYSRISPPNSFINVRDFQNVSDLVGYLKLLDSNPDLYLQYFEWKKEYSVETYPEKTLCDLCEKLNKPIVYKTYESLTQWWFGENCEPGYKSDGDKPAQQSNETLFRSLVQK